MVFLLVTLFFKKERIDTPEMRIFGYLLVANFFGLALEIMSFLFIKFLPVNSFLTIITN